MCDQFLKTFKNLPFAIFAGTGYLIGNLTLTFQGFIEDQPIIPPWQQLEQIDPSSWQSIAGLLWIFVALNTYMVQKFSHGAILVSAVLNLFANLALLISGYTQEVFWAHGLGLLPAFIGVGLMFQGNKENNKKGFYARYPFACAAFLFLLAAPPLLYNAVLSQDWTLTFVICLWSISHIFFGLTDQNFRKTLFIKIG